MLDYEKILSQLDSLSTKIEIAQSDNRVDIYGNRNGLLYLACMLAKFVMEDCSDCYCSDRNQYIAEINFDPGIDTTENSAHLCVFVDEKGTSIKQTVK